VSHGHEPQSPGNITSDFYPSESALQNTTTIQQPKKQPDTPIKEEDDKDKKSEEDEEDEEEVCMDRLSVWYETNVIIWNI
jgi:hypothetical protein